MEQLIARRRGVDVALRKGTSYRSAQRRWLAGTVGTEERTTGTQCGRRYARSSSGDCKDGGRGFRHESGSSDRAAKLPRVETRDARSREHDV
ncbi:unnamed protein product [Trichogramma brassicae]|uniref:Uncharacterized protein n=1 Tax=Trichogramma brassicae TaxID=86971 RepID=A0A6H5ICM2_9HYME|nr:unnamed protein product [Trichogramma brassicae]